MKTIALLDVNLKQTPIGTQSRLADELAGEPILRRTVRRLSECQRIDGIVAACPPSQQHEVTELLKGLSVELDANFDGEPGYRRLVRSARKWSLDAWRGGLGGSSALDEYLNIYQAAAIGKRLRADAVFSLPPGAAIIDPALCDAMMEHAEEIAADIRMVFTQAPPGLAPSIYQTALCEQMASNNVPPGWSLTYKPDDPQTDLVMRPACFAVPQAVRYASGRLCADTARSIRAMRAIVADGADATAELAANWLLDHENDSATSIPREVEIELTTEDPLPDTLLRPRGTRVPKRGPISLDHAATIAESLSTEDDTLVVLGGHGDPVLHPEFGEVLRVLRQGGVYGIAVMTTGQSLSDSAIQALIEHEVEIVGFFLDAWTEETFQQVSRGGSLDAGRSALNRLTRAREQAGRPNPIAVPFIAKCKKNVHELDAFFDGWIRAHGWATVKGYSHYCGKLDDLSCTDMQPPARTACRRLASRCIVLADGTVSACDQDFAGELLLGHLDSATLSEIWGGDARSQLRDKHDHLPTGLPNLCAGCAEWHRP